MALLESIGDPSLIVELSFALCVAKIAGRRVGRRAALVADRDRIGRRRHRAKANFFVGSPVATALVFRGVTRWRLGRDGWREDLDRAVAMARTIDPVSQAARYRLQIRRCRFGVLLPTTPRWREIGEALQMAERSSDDIALVIVRLVLGARWCSTTPQTDVTRIRGARRAPRHLRQERYPLNIVPSLEAYAALRRPPAAISMGP